MGGILAYSRNVRKGSGPGEPRARGKVASAEAGKGDQELDPVGIALVQTFVLRPQIHILKS